MSITSPSRIGQVPDEIFYPAEDGEPMAETQLHIRAIIWLLQALEDFLAAKLDTFIAADMFWYWEEGNPNARRAPDVMVVNGVGGQVRRSFLSWKEGGAIPSVTFEMASEGTWRENLCEKKRLYEQLAVREYFVFDPEAKYLKPPLIGFRLGSSGKYAAIAPDREGRVACKELGCYLQPDGEVLRVIDAATGKPVLLRTEQLAVEKERTAKAKRSVAAARKRAEAETKRVEALEQEVARLKGLLEKGRGA